MADKMLTPGGGAQPFWGLNDVGQSPNQAPLYFTDPWDTFWIGSSQVPGECTLMPGSAISVEVIKKKSKGGDGARVTLGGNDPKTFSLEIDISTAAQWALLQELEDAYRRRSGKKSTLSQSAVSVFHPDLASPGIGIYVAALVDIQLLKPSKTDGAKIRTWTFQVSVEPPRNKNATQTIGPPAEEVQRFPASTSSLLQNGTPPPPESDPGNLGTAGPAYKPTNGVS
ncbi:MAG TPA: hypothetical protein VHG72_21955 [Polyangia bacterium]|nr:hypothetical protein [Polyangia bacterium]